MSIVNQAVRVVLWVALIAAGPGCVDAPAAHDAPSGSISLALVAQSASGDTYRLRHAVITVTGAGPPTVWNTEDAPEQPSLSANVAAGDYAAALQDGWVLDRVDGASATPVTATLISPSPALFTVVPLMRTAVPLQFRVDDLDEVEMSQGYDISISVQAPPTPQLFVGSVQDGPDGAFGSIDVFPSSGDGNIAPRRSIMGPTTTLVSPGALAIAGDQLIVADGSTISFFALSANGDTAPSKRITGSNTTLSSASGLAAANGEIYVSQGDSMIVFPGAASGNVAPVRTIRTPFGAILGLGAVDSGEIYVRMSSVANIAVFPASGSGTLAPTRLIIDATHRFDCLSNPGVLGDELYVADTCAQEIRVYPKVWTGEPRPLRTIRVATRGRFGNIVLSRGQLYSPEADDHEVRTIPVTASGTVFPARTIAGPATNLHFPIGIALR